MKKHLFFSHFLVMLLASAVCLVSCNSTGSKGKVIGSITVENEAELNQSFDATPVARSVSFKADQSWTTEVSSPWISVNPSSGNAGSTKMTITLTANISESSRPGYVKILCGTTPVTVNVIQEGKEKPDPSRSRIVERIYNLADNGDTTMVMRFVYDDKGRVVYCYDRVAPPKSNSNYRRISIERISYSTGRAVSQSHETESEFGDAPVVRISNTTYTLNADNTIATSERTVVDRPGTERTDYYYKDGYLMKIVSNYDHSSDGSTLIRQLEYAWNIENITGVTETVQYLEGTDADYQQVNTLTYTSYANDINLDIVAILIFDTGIFSNSGNYLGKRCRNLPLTIDWNGKQITNMSYVFDKYGRLATLISNETSTHIKYQD